MVNNELYDPEKLFRKNIRVKLPFSNKITSSFRILPSVFLVGVQKGGTSSLYNALIQHKSVIPSQRKEVYFFGNTSNYQKGIRWYKQYFATKFYKKKYDKQNDINGFSIDASTNSFESLEAPARIKKHIPNAKIIILLRNPVFRAYSQYSMAKRLGFEHADFETALKLEDIRLQNAFKNEFADPNHDYVFQRLAYRKKGIYIDYLPNWYSTFGDNVLTLCSEDFFKNPSLVFKQICEFLNIEYVKTIQFDKINAYDTESTIDLKIKDQLQEFYNPYNEKLFAFLNKRYEW